MIMILKELWEAGAERWQARRQDIGEGEGSISLFVYLSIYLSIYISLSIHTYIYIYICNSNNSDSNSNSTKCGSRRLSPALPRRRTRLYVILVYYSMV